MVGFCWDDGYKNADIEDGSDCVEVVDPCWDDGFEDVDVEGEGECVEVWSEAAEIVV